MLIPRGIAALVVAAVALPAPAQPRVEEVQLVAVSDDVGQPFAFEPQVLTISAGTTVRWRNTLDVFHTVTFSDTADRRVDNGTFSQSLAARNATAERAFDTPGSYFYFCQPHSAFMAATITVTAPDDDQSQPASRFPTVLTVIVVIALGIIALGVVATKRRRSAG